MCWSTTTVGLRETATEDHRAILGDEPTGFGRSTTVTDPAGTSAEVVGFTNDVSQVLDPETGVAISGRVPTAVFSLAALSAAGFGVPEAVPGTAGLPWRVSFVDADGETHQFKVREVLRDRSLGSVVCVLEAYRP